MPLRDLLSRGRPQPQRRGRVYTVPHGTPFLEALATALLAGQLAPPRRGLRRSKTLSSDPFALAAVTLLLPTRRDISAVHQAFLKAAGGAALLLPTIKLIAHTGDGLDLLIDAAGEAVADARPQIGKLERELALTRLVIKWVEAMAATPGAVGARTPAQAVRQAKELARLMDGVEMEEVGLAGLDQLVPDDFSQHWGLTLDFLKIVTERWPDHLDEAGKVSPAGWRRALMRAEAERMRATPPSAPVIVAGVTGTVPAATELMRAVLSHDSGVLVLPALDQSLDQDSWDQIVPAHPEHPQFGLKRLIDALGVAREEVALLPGVAPSARQRARASLISEAMRPASTTERWQRWFAPANRPLIETASAGVTVLEAASAGDEAEAVALILRAAVADAKTALLVTPDRALARRVSVRLKAWDLEVPDLAGTPLAGSEVGVFLDLVIEAAAQGFAPVPLLMLLKHPACRLGLPPATIACGIATIELAVFRAPALGHGLSDLIAQVDRAATGTLTGQSRGRAVRLIGEDGWQAARAVAQRVAQLLAPLERLFAEPGAVALATLATAHQRVAEDLSTGAEPGDAPLWQGTGGEELARLFAGILEPSLAAAPELAAADYPEFYRSLLSDQMLPPAAGDPRLAIAGPLEARLQQPEIVILASLNEGTWPQLPDPGPWFNRAMRQKMALPAPEARIGEAAHDFCCLAGAETVYLTRAAKIDGVPTVASRWLQRLLLLLPEAAATAGDPRPWLAWADAKNSSPGRARPVPAPEPRPALALRPRQLALSDVETWIANPYALYAQRILGLERLADLMPVPNAALRGQIIHEALRRFHRRFPDALPRDAGHELKACAHAVLGELAGSPRVAAFWAPRLDRFAAWFAETEPARRRGILKSFAELDGRLVLDGPGGPFTLRARADRIDVGASGLIITDYKTAASLDTLIRNAKAGRAPQLPLEAAIAAAGGFAQVPARLVTGLRYISAAGGTPPGLEDDLALDADEVALLAAAAHAGVSRLIADFDRPDTPYRAVRRPRFRYDYDDFAHLARVAEWAIETDEEAP